jgi:hypothetical protein
MNQLSIPDKSAQKKTYMFDVWSHIQVIHQALFPEFRWDATPTGDVADRIVEHTVRFILDDASCVGDYVRLEEAWLLAVHDLHPAFIFDGIDNHEYSTRVYDRLLVPLKDQLLDELSRALKVAPHSVWSVHCDGSSLYIQYLGDARIIEWELQQAKRTKEQVTTDLQLRLFKHEVETVLKPIAPKERILSVRQVMDLLQSNESFYVAHSSYSGFLAEPTEGKESFKVQLAQGENEAKFDVLVNDTVLFTYVGGAQAKLISQAVETTYALEELSAVLKRVLGVA